jgi:hypothetical protein
MRGADTFTESMDKLKHGDHASVADALPGYAQRECIELGPAQRATNVLGPGELAAVQATCGQPHADAIVHQHIHAVGAPAREELGVVRPGRAEDRDDSRQCCFGAGAHVQSRHRHPHDLDADHRSNSRIQPDRSMAALTGQLSLTLVPPRRNSVSMVRSSAARGTTGATATGTNCSDTPTA